MMINLVKGMKNSVSVAVLGSLLLRYKYSSVCLHEAK
jgi:hypothetical protein